MAKRHVLREGIEEHAKSGTYNRFAFSGNVPRGTHTRSEVFLIRVVKAAQTGLSDLGQREASSPRCGRDACDVAQQVVLFLNYSEIVPTQSVIEGQPRGNPVAVLDIETKVVFVGVSYRVAEVLEAADNVACEEILETSCDQIAASIERV